jgi:hypothetical protein
VQAALLWRAHFDWQLSDKPTCHLAPPRGVISHLYIFIVVKH